MTRSAQPVAAGLLLCGASLLLVGCKTIDAGLLELFPPSDPAPSASQVRPFDGPTYLVVLKSSDEAPQQMKVPLEGVVYVQDALVRSGALKTYRRVSLELIRRGEGGAPHRLEIEYDRANHRVASAFDYALHPNDQLIISEDPSTIVDDMLHAVTGR